jgi:hypothetical protein
MTQYEIKIVASGEVRDKDGNLKETVPVETTRIVDEKTLRALLGKDN